MALQAIALAPEVSDLLELSMPENVAVGTYRIVVDLVEPETVDEFAARLGLLAERVSENGGGGWPEYSFEGDLLSIVGFLAAYNGTTLTGEQIVEIGRRIAAAN